MCFSSQLRYRPYIIEVSGDVLAKEGKNYAQSWTAGSCGEGKEEKESKYTYKKETHSVDGDLFFDKNLRAVPYAIYVAYGSVGIKDGAAPGTDLGFSSGFYPAFAYFNEYIKEVQINLDVAVDERIKRQFYNGLYIGAISVLELFLCDFLMCGVFSREEYFLKAVKALKIKVSVDQFKMETKIKNVVYGMVFHRFDKLAKLFDSIFDFKFPDYRELQLFIRKRHNIVHRFALSSDDRMKVCDASHDDVLKLINTICAFVQSMKVACGLSTEEKNCLELKLD